MGFIKTPVQRALKFLKARILPSYTQPDEPLANETPVPIEPVSVSSIDELRLSKGLKWLGLGLFIRVKSTSV